MAIARPATILYLLALLASSTCGVSGVEASPSHNALSDPATGATWSARAKAAWADLKAKRQAAAQQSTGERMAELLSAAEACGDWQTAADAASALAVAENRADYWARAALARLALGDRRAAGTECFKAIRLDPNNARALAVRALLAIRLQPFDFSQAKAHALAAVSADPHCGEALGALALIALMESQPQSAMPALERGMADANISAPALYYGAGCALAVGRRDLARRWAERLVDRWPAHPYTRVARTGLVPVSVKRVAVRLIYPAFTRDGRRVVFWPGKGLLHVADVDRLSEPLAETAIDASYGPTAWTADGAVLICEHSSRVIRLRRWDLKEAPKILVTKRATKRQRFYLQGLTSDGVAFLEYDRSRHRQPVLKLIDPAGHERELGEVPRSVGWISASLLSLEADAALATYRYRSLLLWRLETSQVTTLWPDSGAYVRPLAWIGDGGLACAAVVSRADYPEGFLTIIPIDDLPSAAAPVLPMRTSYAAMSANGRVMSFYVGLTSVVCRFAPAL